MAKNSIKMKNYGQVQEEFAAAAGINPGNLVELNAAGNIQKHSGAGKTALTAFAIEDELQGKGITDAYVTGDRVQVWIAQRGDIVLCTVKTGENIVTGDFVESNGDGTLKKVTRAAESWESADSQQAKSLYDLHIVGQAIEAQTASAFLAIRIL